MMDSDDEFIILDDECIYNEFFDSSSLDDVMVITS